MMKIFSRTSESRKNDLIRILENGFSLSYGEAKLIGKTPRYEKNNFRYISDENLRLEDQGNNSVIFKLISQTPLIAKFPIRVEDLPDIIKGYEIQRVFEMNGIKVAKTKGIYNVYMAEKKSFRTGFVMEFREGKRLSDYNHESKEYLRGLNEAMHELDKMTSMGYKSKYQIFAHGFKEENVLWWDKTGLLTMLDFDFDSIG